MANSALKLTLRITSAVLQKGILSQINVHSKNYGMIQNKYAQTMKQFIMSITGTQELSKEILHKQINFICTDDSTFVKNSLHSGKNYSVNFVRSFANLGIDIKAGLIAFDTRFLI